ncbi:uncharacterized protein LOC135378998 [Ornithodoros turicata]|uniref:uncharacterized protein LOC135378998 n=1 Tax=Ornithodoros turicata TaxID=34597 RepID=UPI003138B3D4
MSLIEHLMGHPKYLNYVKLPQGPENNGVLRDFGDGLRASNHPILAKCSENVLSIVLYSDDIELSNPIGAKRGLRGKLSMFYVTFANIPPHERSKVSNIFLLAVGHAKHLKTAKAKSLLLHDFITAVNNLHDGVTVVTPTGTEVVHGSLLAYIGDSLAAHNMGGFKEGFSRNVRLSCRTCKTETADFHKHHYDDRCTPRTNSEINKQVQALTAAKSNAERKRLSAEFGVNAGSVLSEIQHFSLVDDILYDPMHILLEGIVPREISLFAKYLIFDGKVVTKQALDLAITSFNYHHSVETTMRPRALDSDCCPISSASATYMLLLHLPLMLDSYIASSDEPHAACLLLLCRITQAVLSPLITVDGLADLEELIAQHSRLYVQCYGAQKFLPKHHMLVHIVRQIKMFGPARHHWTMRFESKNALAKSKKLWNFKNVPQSVAEMYQMKMSFDLWDSDGKPREGSSTRSSSRTMTPFPLLPEFVNCGVPQEQVGSIALSVSSIFVNNVNIKEQDIMVMGDPTENAEFVKIRNIVLWQGTTFFVCSVLANAGFVHKLNAFLLQEREEKSVLKECHFLYPWPLLIYNMCGRLYCIAKCFHYIPQEDSSMDVVTN